MEKPERPWLGMFFPRAAFRPRVHRESLSPPQEHDLEQLEELRRQGSRLELPHPVRGFCAFDEEKSARDAAERLTKDGFRCQVRSGTTGEWAVTAIVQLIPTAGAITRLREQLTEVADSLDGDYRGWDAPPVY